MQVLIVANRYHWYYKTEHDNLVNKTKLINNAPIIVHEGIFRVIFLVAKQKGWA